MDSTKQKALDNVIKRQTPIIKEQHTRHKHASTYMDSLFRIIGHRDKNNFSTWSKTILGEIDCKHG